MATEVDSRISLADRDREAFVVSGTSGKICRRVCIDEGSISATFTPSGLSTAFVITTLDVTDTAALIPPTPLSGRNTVSIFNTSIETVYLGPTNAVTADRVNGTTSGWELGPLENINFDYKDSVGIYAIAETGKTIKIKIMEG